MQLKFYIMNLSYLHVSIYRAINYNTYDEVLRRHPPKIMRCAKPAG
jgi:hypothetical protein